MERVFEIGGDKYFVNSLITEIDSRFELMCKPCIDAISRKLQLKLSENI